MNKPIKATLLKMPRRRGPFVSSVESRILFLRHQRVILDAEIALLYGVPVKRLNEQVKRNQERFPSDFMFRLTEKEPFNEHGAIMAATVLNSKRAVQMSVFVVRAFVRLREMLATNRHLAGKIYELENRLDSNDSVIVELIQAIKQLITPKKRPRVRIGLQLPAGKAKARLTRPA